ncbi:MAG: nicotinamide riboside transporter PnuC [SAR86 cluster bacterium]|nr:nicotinamide mononucleotide transporter [Gammaproteobacteria bacterium]RCL36287.1 MAG: nicotinamide riboside transporter PnuC [SAR86 cluster bacterium]
MVLNLVLESLAVVTAIMYLILAAKEDVRCWYAALISSILYFYIMLQAGLLMEGGLQIFYVFMAVYGWMQWKDTNNKTSSLKISSWKKTTHLIIISFVITLSLISGIFLEKFTNAALPFLDALTTWGAIASTYMVAKKVIENWFYWFVIDSISIYLFISRELFLTAFLFLIYLVIIIYGYRSWKKLLKNSYDNI